MKREWGVASYGGQKLSFMAETFFRAFAGRRRVCLQRHLCWLLLTES